jgi:hypothetical protein
MQLVSGPRLGGFLFSLRSANPNFLAQTSLLPTDPHPSSYPGALLRDTHGRILIDLNIVTRRLGVTLPGLSNVGCLSGNYFGSLSSRD